MEPAIIATAVEDKRQRGRPSKEDWEKREQRFNLRLTLAEKNRIELAAHNLGVEPAEYARQRVLVGRLRTPVRRGSPPKNSVDPALMVTLNELGLKLQELAPQFADLRDQISREGNVVNQLARKSNADIPDRELKKTLQDWEHLPAVVAETNAKAMELFLRFGSTIETIAKCLDGTGL